jgi:hypothetical protein
MTIVVMVATAAPPAPNSTRPTKPEIMYNTRLLTHDHGGDGGHRSSARSQQHQS